MTYGQALMEAGRAIDAVEAKWGTDAAKIPAHRLPMWLRAHERWQVLVNLMDDERREKLHAERVPCGCGEFAVWYIRIDPDLGEVEAF